MNEPSDFLPDPMQRARVDGELDRQKRFLDELFELAPDAVVLTTLRNPRILRINREFTRIFGYTPEEAVGNSLRNLVMPDGREPVLPEDPDLLAGEKVEWEVIRRRKDGTRFHAHITGKRIELSDDEDAAYLIFRDISMRKQADALFEGEKRLLEIIAAGGALTTTLDALSRLAEDVDGSSLVSILLLDRNGKFHPGAGPSLPQSYVDALDGWPVGLGVGPCAAAAHLGEQVISLDLAADQRWADQYRALASAHGLRVCWSTPIKSSDGRVLGTFAIYPRDPRSPTAEQRSTIAQLTHLASIAIERAQSIDALRRSDERYALAMEAAEEGHFDADLETGEMFVSARLNEIYNFPRRATIVNRAEFLNQIPLHPDDRSLLDDIMKGDRVRQEWQKPNQDHFEYDCRFIPRPGEIRWLRVRGKVIRDAAGHARRRVGVAADITERKRVEEELRSRQEMLEVAQKAARAVAFEWRVDADKGENRWSPDLEAMYGIPAGSYDGTYESWKHLVHPEDWPNVRAAIKTAQQTGDVDAEYRVLHPGGMTRWLHAKGRMLFDSERQRTRIVGFMIDVTDRHAGAEELQRMERQLRQAQRLEALGTLAGGIAHDFNNLLGAILGYGEMALRNVRAGSRLRRDIENIMIAGERGHALVERILAFSRSGVGERVAVHVEGVVRETLALFAAKMPPYIAVETRLHAGRAAVMGDPTQIHQVLMNLLTNAVQAMPSGGTLRVSLDRIQLQAPCVATTGSIAAREYLVMDVSDSGSGIPAEILEKIFDPFFSTKEVGVGTGLGLSLVHGIVTGLGGAIDVATSVAKGSVFKVYLPLTDDVAMPSKPRRRLQRKTQRMGRGRVMVIDDEEALVTLAADTLTELGYSAVSFTSSRRGIEAFLADPEQFDAVITDESMPGASGSEIIRKMRALKPNLPILLVSGYLSAAVSERAREAGATEVLKKPLSARQLQTALERVLETTSGLSTNDLPSSKPSGPAAKPRRRVGSSQSQAGPARR